MNLAEASEQFAHLSTLLDKGIAAMIAHAEEYAEAEDAYRMARAIAHAKTDGTVDERRMAVDRVTSKERQRAHLAEAMKQAGVEAVRSRRAQLSALQTLLNAHQAELQMLRVGQDT